LREALASSNTNTPVGNCALSSGPAVNTITFSLPANSVINLDDSLGQLSATTNDVNVVGPGSLTVNGPPTAAINHRVLSIGSITVNLSGMTISGGKEGTAGLSDNGGGIESTGALTLTNVTVTGNTDTSSGGTAIAQGGGIHAQGALTLNNSIVQNNQVSAQAATNNASSVGGGIWVSGPLVIKNSTVQGNTTIAGTTGGGSARADALGGGIRGSDTNSVQIDHSTISGNLATATNPSGTATTAQGGGLIALGSSTGLELTTVAGNRLKVATGSVGPALNGGGVASESGTADSYVSSTIAANGLDPTSSTTGASGLNFYAASGGTKTFVNTIIANPVGSAGSNCGGNSPIATGGTPNVDFPFNGTHPCFTAAFPILNSDPQLGGLGANGGPTATLLPQPTSPVIDQGTAGFQVDAAHDQRGLARPVDFPGLANPFDGSDIGSVEVQQACGGQSTPTSSCTPTATPAANPPAAAPTGLRAGALKKCKKKHSKNARKKCRKRANLLPV
jgi:hypothetical protein